jgi:hypothetical protein
VAGLHLYVKTSSGGSWVCFAQSPSAPALGLFRTITRRRGWVRFAKFQSVLPLPPLGTAGGSPRARFGFVLSADCASESILSSFSWTTYGVARIGFVWQFLRWAVVSGVEDVRVGQRVRASTPPQCLRTCVPLVPGSERSRACSAGQARENFCQRIVKEQAADRSTISLRYKARHFGNLSVEIHPGCSRAEQGDRRSAPNQRPEATGRFRERLTVHGIRGLSRSPPCDRMKPSTHRSRHP